MTITVIARDATGRKSTWHFAVPAELEPIAPGFELARNEVALQIAEDTKQPARVVLALVPSNG